MDVVDAVDNPDLDSHLDFLKRKLTLAEQECSDLKREIQALEKQSVISNHLRALNNEVMKLFELLPEDGAFKELQNLATELRSKMEKLKTERADEIHRARFVRLCLANGDLLRIIGEMVVYYNAGLSNAKPEEIEGLLAEIDDIASEKGKPIKLKLSFHGDSRVLENPLSAKNSDNLTEVVDSSEAEADATRKTTSLKSKASSRETNVASQKTIKLKLRLHDDSRTLENPPNAKKHKLCSQDEGCRYIPQLGDEVVYLRQGHQEYIDMCHLAERGPWTLFGENIKDVEICSVVDVDYANLAGSGERRCKAKLRFVDPLSSVCGKTFTLTLPEFLISPDFVVEKTRYDASLERSWRSGDKCFVWWPHEGGGGKWWKAQIVSISDKSIDFPGSPWERILVTYVLGDDVDPCRHSPWELHDKRGTT